MIRDILITTIALFFVVGVCRAQEPESKQHFEVSLSENLLSGTLSLMNYAGVNIGYSFKTNDKVILDLSFGRGIMGQDNRTQFLSLLYAHEFLYSRSFGTQVGIGPGIMRNINPDGTYSLMPVGSLDLQHRIYFTQKSFVGFSAKAHLSKGFHQASFIGFVWGVKL